MFTFFYLFCMFMNVTYSSTVAYNLPEADSTKVKIFNGFKSINPNDISATFHYQRICFVFNDSKLLGKQFKLYVKEFDNGKVVDKNELLGNAETSKMIPNKDHSKFYYVDNTKINRYNAKDTNYVISFLCTNNDNCCSRMLITKNRRQGVFTCTKESSDFILNSIQSGNNEYFEKSLPIGRDIPILSFSPGLILFDKIESYDIMACKEPESWYKSFNMKHYYIVYLDIV